MTQIKHFSDTGDLSFVSSRSVIDRPYLDGFLFLQPQGIYLIENAGNPVGWDKVVNITWGTGRLFNVVVNGKIFEKIGVNIHECEKEGYFQGVYDSPFFKDQATVVCKLYDFNTKTFVFGFVIERDLQTGHGVIKASSEEYSPDLVLTPKPKELEPHQNVDEIAEEFIICAAIWYKDLEMIKPEVLEIRGFRPYNVDKGIVFSGWRHPNCLYQMVAMTGLSNAKAGKHIQGFLTSKNRFVDRQEAFKIALKNCQLKGPLAFNESTTDLFSEHLY